MVENTVFPGWPTIEALPAKTGEHVDTMRLIKLLLDNADKMYIADELARDLELPGKPMSPPNDAN